MDNRSTVAAESKQNFWRCVATGAAILASLFVICWIGAAVSSLRLSHMFIQLLTTVPVDCGVARVGVCSFLVFGAITGAPIRPLLQFVRFRQALDYLSWPIRLYSSGRPVESAYVRFWHEADICVDRLNVRF